MTEHPPIEAIRYRSSLSDISSHLDEHQSDDNGNDNDDYNIAPPSSNTSYPSIVTSKKGRRGDPRMHRAVAARLANPQLSLLDALRAGGFEFPPLDEDGANISHIKDADEVQLSQRKNQLSRRLRLVRRAQKMTGGSEGDISVPTTTTSAPQARDVVTVTTTGHKGPKTETVAAKPPKKKRVHQIAAATQQQREKLQAAAAALSAGTPAAVNNLSSYSSLLFSQRNKIPGWDHHAAAGTALLGSLSGLTSSSGIGSNKAPTGVGSMGELLSPPPLGGGTGVSPLLGLNSLSSYSFNNETTAAMAARLGVTPLSEIMNQGMEEEEEREDEDEDDDVLDGETAVRGNGHVEPDRTTTTSAVGMETETETEMDTECKEDDKKKLQMALELFRAENATVLKRCMLMAGYDPQETEECDDAYLSFVTDALDSENQRLMRLYLFYVRKQNDANGKQLRINENSQNHGQQNNQNDDMDAMNDGAVNILSKFLL